MLIHQATSLIGRPYASLCNKERLSRLDLDGLKNASVAARFAYTYKIVFNLVSEAANDYVHAC